MERTVLHRRTVSVDTHPLSTGRLYVYSELRDVRYVDLPAYLGVTHPKGVVHHMGLALELDGDLVIRAADARMMTAPFEPTEQTWGEGCRQILPNYQRLVGLRVDESYPLRVLETVGSRLGCFHILSLAQCLPAAIRAATRRLCAQALRMPETGRDSVLDSCVQWRRDSPLWGESRPSSDAGFRDFRRHISIEAHTIDGARLGLDGRLEDDPADTEKSRAELMLELAFPSFTIVSAEARLDPPPFAGCASALDGARDLHRLSISKGFTGAALEKIGGGAGCAHLSALLIAVTPVTAQAAGAVAGFLGFRPEQRPRDGRANPQIDSCHMWRGDGPLVSLKSDLPAEGSESVSGRDRPKGE